MWVLVLNMEILTRKKIKANSISKAMEMIKTKYPYAKWIAYKFEKDFRFSTKKDYDNRTMKVCFVKNIKEVWN